VVATQVTAIQTLRLLLYRPLQFNCEAVAEQATAI